MLRLHTHTASPDTLPRASDAIRRATADAETIPGAFASTPCQFAPLLAEALPGNPRGVGRWILVSCTRTSDPAHQAHLQERCLTAAQRFLLSLWRDGVDAVWVSDALPDAAALTQGGADLSACQPIGLVWCPD